MRTPSFGQLGSETDTQDASGEELRTSAFDHVRQPDLRADADLLTLIC